MREFDDLKNKTIVHITTAHQYNDVRIFHREAKLLVPYFFKVYIVAPGCKEEIFEGVNFIRWGEKRPLGRIERLKSVKNVIKVLEKIDFDIIHFHDPEFIIFLPLLKKDSATKLVYDVHEYYYGTLYENSGGGFKGWLLANIYSLIEKVRIKNLDGIVTVSPQLLDYYRKYHDNVVMIRNFPDVKNIIDSNNDGKDGFNSYNLLYSGSLEQKALFPLAHAVSKLKEKYEDIKVTLVGDFKDPNFKNALFKHYRSLGLEGRLIHIPRMERSQFLKTLSLYTLGLVLFHPSKNAEVGLPNKLFEYMAAKLPVVVPDLPNQKEIVLKHRCGTFCNTKDPDSIREAIEEILRDRERAKIMGENGRNACITEYNSEIELKKLLLFYSEILK